MKMNARVNVEPLLFSLPARYLILTVLLILSVAGWMCFEDDLNFIISKIILGSGIIISILIFLILKIMADSGRRAEFRARQRILALSQSEEKFRLINDFIDDVVWLQSKDDLKILYVNPSYEKVWGRTCQSLYDDPKSFMESVHPEDMYEVKAKYEDYYITGRLELEYRILNPDSKVRWVYARGFPINDSSGHVANHCGVATDITERKQSEEALRRMSELLNISGGLAKIGGWELDIETQIITWTEQTYRIHEADPAHQHQLAAGINYYTPESQPIIAAAVQAAIENGESYDLELELVTARGKTIWVRALGIAEGRDGKTLRLLGAIQDITERKHAETELRLSEARFRLAMTHSPMGFALADSEGHFLEVNPALCETTGYTKEELLQTTFQAITHADDLDADISYMRQILEGEITTYRMKKRYIHRDGHPVWVLLCVSLIKKEDGLPNYFILQIVDITAEKQSEQDSLSMLAAEEASRQKSLFLSSMSHEIRTPMNAILGFAQVLDRDPSLTPGQRQQVYTINRSGHHLLQLINDILDISRIESGMIELNSVVFELGDFLDDMEMMFRSRADAKDLQFLIERDAGLPAWVRGDEGKLRQVLINMLGNSVKFTKSGWVKLRVRCISEADHTDEDGKPLRLFFEVEDSGPGVPASEHERIFKAFEKGEAAGMTEGTGLGLSISRKLAEKMGGTLTVDSVVGEGSCFRFDMLCESAEAITKIKKSESPRVVGLKPGSGPWRVLVVDDVESNRDLLVALLMPLGFELREAENGTKAIDIFEEWSPHAVLMDIRMPVMDGYEATRRIKAAGAQDRTTHIIAVTASTFMDSREEMSAMGFSAYLSKPFRPEELFEALRECLGLRYEYADGHVKAPKHPGAPKLTPEVLAALPGELVRAMQKAVADGDMKKLAELIFRVEALDESAARGLKRLADRYDYTKLNKLLGKGGNNNG